MEYNLEEELQKQKNKILELNYENHNLILKIKKLEEKVYIFLEEELNKIKNENDKLKSNLREYKFMYNDTRHEEIINFFNNISLSITYTSDKYDMTIEETMEFIKEYSGLHGNTGLYSAIDYQKCYFNIHGILDSNYESPYNSDSDCDSDSESYKNDID